MDAVATQETTARVPSPRVEDVLSKVVERLEALEKSQRSRGFWDWLLGRKPV
jgi:phosphoenolpyruvate carboxylase